MNGPHDTGAARIVVLGSLNMDLVLRVPHAPAAGETLQGRSMTRIPGGKGGNQAVSCARQGARVTLVGCVGADADGEALLLALREDRIDVAAVRSDATAPTGTALVMVDDTGQNRIVVIPGANAHADADDAAWAAHLQSAAFLVTQFETPWPQVLRAIEAAGRARCKVLLNPSPVRVLDLPVWPLIDTLVVNEIEATTLSGIPSGSPAEAALAGAWFRDHGVTRVVVTLGARGAVAIDAAGARHHPAPHVQAVDTTAAGDTFLGALAVALADDASFDEAVRLGIRAAALCITQPGAQPSIPFREAVLSSRLPPDWTLL
ncbi:ribokinase [Variovorax sp. PAMC 28711]|uniref:ribokinase n=1 Tax=Variovorax sp. PAMC 28711 TaxID=1795631 RepID=UPI00078BC597|nr:ribokinase [Variovorax sp. PAMC 28711]AMM25283.1 ribokinase [Variovorax sp. PAMC 28711]